MWTKQAKTTTKISIHCCSYFMYIFSIENSFFMKQKLFIYYIFIVHRCTNIMIVIQHKIYERGLNLNKIPSFGYDTNACGSIAIGL